METDHSANPANLARRAATSSFVMALLSAGCLVVLCLLGVRMPPFDSSAIASWLWLPVVLFAAWMGLLIGSALFAFGAMTMSPRVTRPVAIRRRVSAGLAIDGVSFLMVLVLITWIIVSLPPG